MLDDVEAAIAWARNHAREIGRTAPLGICFSAAAMLDDDKSLDERHATLDRLAAAGVTWLTIAPVGEDRTEYLERAGNFAKEFISP